jgi:mannose/cellobiose epimerase-like protein (N-acyl-D-glucosamine 2-epimerase family)
MTPPSEIRALRDRLKSWLLERAFPIWWNPGADHVGGGFHDRLDAGGRPMLGPKRARVAARQVFSYAAAGAFGWDGPWREAIDHGLAFLEHGHRQPDGLYRAQAAPPTETVDLYDQAFVLLALSVAASHGDTTAPARAEALLARLIRQPEGGFAPFAGPLDANPNMHLFEAFLAWDALNLGGPWREAAAGQARLAMTRFIDPETGAQSELFGASWASPPSAEREVWPGHQFEWAWLLMRWNLVSGDAAAFAAALRLVELGERAGVDHERNVAIYALDGTLAVIDPKTRMWPQTERLRVAALAALFTGDASLWDMTLRAAAGLQKFLDVPTPGLWRDSLESEDLSAPASSLYHVVGAIVQLDRVVEGAA